MDNQMIKIENSKRKPTILLILLWIFAITFIVIINRNNTNILSWLVVTVIVFIPMSYYLYISTYLKYISRRGQILILDNQIVINKIWRYGHNSKKWYKISFEDLNEIGITKTKLNSMYYYILTDEHIFLIDINYKIKEEFENHIPKFHELWNHHIKDRTELLTEVKR